MLIEYCTVDDLKALRPELYQAIAQEIFLGKLRLTKDDILNMLQPLSDNIKDYLRPYLDKMPRMTYNDIVDMENDIIDEIAEHLLNEFDDLEELVRKRSDYASPKPQGKETSIVEKNEEAVTEEDYEYDEDENVEVGYVLKLFPSQKTGKIIAIKNLKNGLRKLVLQMNDGTTREEYDNNNLYIILKRSNINGEEVESSASEEADQEPPLIIEIPQNTMEESSPEKKEAITGDNIIYDGKRCKVIGKKTMASSMRLIIQYEDGTLDNVPNDWNRYSLMSLGKNGNYYPASDAVKQIGETNKKKKKAMVGDWVIRTSDNLIGKVVEIKKLGSGIEKLILELEDGSLSGVFNSTKLYRVLQ